ncbi:hypothetical protein GCM10022231_08230 [Gordonia caeni]|uniref:Mce-associated membrane protein n=1 Tax=Gordonia caeni TaxID=1007097 RepID=A0ABP7NR79_9ACTN
MRRWRIARAARDRARDDLTDAEVSAGVTQRLSISARTVLAVTAVLVLVGAGVVVWQAVERTPAYSDQQLVDAASERVELLLTADAGDDGRARAILAGATGEFYDSFAQSAEAYTRFVEEQGSTGDARIDGAALASRDGDRGVVLIAARMSVNAGAVEGRNRQLRLRVVTEPEDGVLKLSGVTFLP